MNEREHILADLSAYLDGELSPPQAARVEQALQTDASLAKELAGLRRTREMVRALPRVKPGEDFVSSVLEKAERVHLVTSGDAPARASFPFLRWVGAAAVLLLAIGVGATVTVMLYNAPSVGTVAISDQKETALVSPAPSTVMRPVPSAAEGPAPSNIEGPASGRLFQAAPAGPEGAAASRVAKVGTRSGEGPTVATTPPDGESTGYLAKGGEGPLPVQTEVIYAYADFQKAEQDVRKLLQDNRLDLRKADASPKETAHGRELNILVWADSDQAARLREGLDRVRAEQSSVAAVAPVAAPVMEDKTVAAARPASGLPAAPLGEGGRGEQPPGAARAPAAPAAAAPGSAPRPDAARADGLALAGTAARDTAGRARGGIEGPALSRAEAIVPKGAGPATRDRGENDLLEGEYQRQQVNGSAGNTEIVYPRKLGEANSLAGGNLILNGEGNVFELPGPTAQQAAGKIASAGQADGGIRLAATAQADSIAGQQAYGTNVQPQQAADSLDARYGRRTLIQIALRSGPEVGSAATPADQRTTGLPARAAAVEAKSDLPATRPAGADTRPATGPASGPASLPASTGR